MNRIEKTGRTVDDAVQAALKELGVSREDVLIEVLEEGKDALFGLIKRDAKVRVTVKEAEKAAALDSFEEQLETVPETPEGPAPKEEPEVTEAPVSSDAEEERKAAAQDAKTFLETLFKAMGMDRSRPARERAVTRAWQRVSPTGVSAATSASGARHLAFSRAARYVSTRRTMPAPPPQVVSSTLRWRSVA